MAEAHAKMHLREIVRDDDVDLSISVMLESFIQSQKFSIARMIKKRFASYITYREDVNSLLLHILGKLEKEQVNKIVKINEMLNILISSFISSNI